MRWTKLAELAEELRTVLAGRWRLADSLAPTLVFVVLQAVWTLAYALGSAIVLALIVAGIRVVRREPFLYALGGLVGVSVAAGIAIWMGQAEGFFLPSILGGGLSVVACIVSLVAGRPLVAWTSHLARRWPLGWYWHPKVRPAYSHVTLAWAIYFSLRLLLQLWLFQDSTAEILALVSTAMGWPSTIVLLVLSYLYGVWKLGQLHGPSVKEFEAGADPPWMGQRRGF
jgi:hypothetical protein